MITTRAPDGANKKNCGEALLKKCHGYNFVFQASILNQRLPNMFCEYNSMESPRREFGFSCQAEISDSAEGQTMHIGSLLLLLLAPSGALVVIMG